ncbi:interferon-stimulated 20 kDa exonuclease-like 2 [Mastacembelus armatus]|uniref:Interferon stimulated exonuclease gene 20-like 2 n=1 Tax=Mastacembelus armatus TaxID=205130 RepID=A0A3Q3SNR5_9TELE|nr:interferon-stimulated 20 kDa exonuclease-like 2 [Mastacembelus armatus]
MSGIVINVFVPEDPVQGTTAGQPKRKKYRFHKKKRHLVQNSGLMGKHTNSHDPTKHHDGAATKPPPLPAPTPNRCLPGSGSTAGASHSSSMTTTSAHTLPPRPVAVSGEGERPKEPVNISSEIPGPSLSCSHKHTVPTKYLAIDCEMVGVGPKGRVSQLARCSIVSYEGDIVFDKFINPSMPVTDYRTRWSGIRRSDLVKATPFSEARKEILKLLMGKVVIGHAIYNDFKALGYSHPAALTRDTSRIPLLNLKAGFSKNECASLKRLTKAIFNRDIQTGKRGHSSVEDARATMELYKVVEEEWERTLASSSQAS